MRVLWISMTILCLFIIFSIYFTYSLEKSSYDIIELLDRVEENIIKDDWEESLITFNKMEKTWRDISAPWKIFVDHGELDRIETTMIRAKEYITVNNKDLGRTEISVLKLLLKNLYTKEKLTIENIL